MLCLLGYEPADLTVHHPPPPKKNAKGWFIFLSYRCLVFPEKNVLKGKHVLFGDI